MKRFLSVLLAIAMCISFLPTFASAEVGDTFNVNLYDVTGATADELTNYYSNASAYGSNWKINSAETSSEHYTVSRLQVAKKDPAFSGFKFWTIASGKGNFAIDFTVPKAGCYKVHINVVPYKSGGTEIKASLNGTALSTFDSYGSMEEWGDALTGIRKTEIGAVYLKAGEFANTIVFAPQNGNLLFESITLEEVDPVPTPVVFNFYKELDPKPAKGMSVADTAGPGFITIAEESSTYVNDTRSYSTGGYAYPQFDVCKGATTWINSNNDRGSKWTFKLPISAAGWYDVDFLGAKWFANDDFYLYVDDQFAGYYNFYSAKSAANNNGNNIELGEWKEMNSLYLTPDEDGYVKVMLAIAKSNGYGHGRLAPIEMRLTPFEDQDIKCVDIVHTLPEELSFGDTAEFTAYAVMSDGSRRSFNGYTSTATADSDNGLFIKSATSGVAVTRTSDQLFDEGVYAGIVSAADFGAQKVTLTAKVGGVEYSEEATINVANPETPVTFKLGLSGDDFAVAEGNGDYGNPANWKIAGATLVPEKTTTVDSRRYVYTTWGTFNQLTTVSGHGVWPNLTTDTQMTMITLSKNIPCAGYYDIDFTGYLWIADSDYAIYVNGEFAGNTNCYVNPDGWGTTATTRLNKLYLPEGPVEISFRARKSHYSGGMFFTPKDMTFTPATVAEIKVSEVETSGIPETMEAGAVAEASAKAKMTDGEYRHFGYANNGMLPTEDVIKVSSSNPAIVAVTDVVCVKVLTKAENENKTFTIDPQTTTYKLNALRAGSADITVTAIVDGKETSVTKTITVSGEAMGETISKTGASVSIVALTGGSVETSLNNVVDNVPFGTTVTAEAAAQNGYKFAYWQDSNGKVLSDKSSETFVINTNTSIMAYFEKLVTEADAEVPVYFYNGNGEILEKKSVAKQSVFGDIKISSPSLVGYVFAGWNVEDEAVINNVTRAVALFDDSETTYSVVVDDGIYSTTQSGKKYGDKVTVTARGEDTFSCWMIGDDIVSYSKSFTFAVYGNTTITAVYGEELEVSPTVALEEVNGNYFLTYNVPEGFEKIEAGILFSKTGTPRVGASYSKAIAKTGSGQFTAKPMGDDDNIARGYVMYRDGDAIKVIYAK